MMDFFEIFGTVIQGAFGLFQLPIEIGGFTISLWQVFCFSVVVSLIGLLIGAIFGGND